MILALALILSLAIAPARAAGLNASSTAPVTREAFASALWEHEGKPAVNYAMSFSDVAQTASYADAPNR